MHALAYATLPHVSPLRRLVATAISASLAIWLLGAMISRTDIPGVDQLIRWAPFAVPLTIFVITGVANSINIIDGFNGWNSTAILSWFLLVFVVSYIWLYSRIVRFKTPRWMVFRRTR